MTTKIRLSAEARKVAKSLAVAYSAFHQALNNDDANGLSVWGKQCLKRQEQLGIDLLDVGVTLAIISRAEKEAA